MTATHPGFAVSAGSLPSWCLLFAREPEQDLDFDDGPEAPDHGEGMQPDEPEEPSGRRPLILIVAVLAVAGALYFAWDAGMLTGLLGPSGDSTAVTPANPAGRPQPVPPVPGPPPQAMDDAPKPAQPQAMPATPPMTASRAEAKPAPPIMDAPRPMFTEGQHVSVVPDPTLPAAAVSLSSDAGGNKPGPIISPITVLIIIDGELRNTGWVYAVRTPEGITGWISERRLHTATP